MMDYTQGYPICQPLFQNFSKNVGEGLTPPLTHQILGIRLLRFIALRSAIYSTVAATTATTAFTEVVIAPILAQMLQ